MHPNYMAALRFQAAWLDVAPERLQGEGFVNPTAKREESIPGYHKPVRAHALRMEGRQDIYAACVPGLENKLRLNKMSHRLFFWFEGLNPAIDVSPARPLGEEDLPAFLRFFKEAYPDTREHDWIPEYFREITARQRCFGVFEDGLLVSVADSPNVPYLPELVVEPGIMTLPGARKKGYAAAVCSAFLQEQVQQGLSPIWTCAADNEGSVGLAQHLGFRFFGDLWRLM